MAGLLLPLGGGEKFTLGTMYHLCLFECLSEMLMRCPVSQDFTWIVIHPSLNALDLSVTDDRDGLAFRDESADELMLVLAGPAFI